MQSLTTQSLCVGSLVTYKKYYNYGEKTNVVLLGQGWFAKGFLENINHKKFHITNITRHEFVNTPMLLKTINPKNTSDKNNKFVEKIDELIYDEITKIDLENKCVSTKNKSIYWNNGYLICGLGSNEDIGKKWLPLIDNIKNIKTNNNYCIVGTGPTGTELAFHLKDKNNFISVVDLIDKEESYKYISQKGKDIILEKLDITFKTPFTENMRKNFDQVIFATGSRPNDLTKGWDITPKLNLLNYNEVFVGGDCIHGSVLPRNAQVAYQQGKYVAETLNQNKFKEKDFEYNNNGIALYIGNNDYYVETKFYNGKIPEFFVELYYSIFK